MPSPKPKSPPKSSPGKGKGSPKKGEADKKATENQAEEDELVVPVPQGIMHHRMRFILESMLKADVEFMVGPDHAQTQIKAHKCMLAAESPMFESLFTECDEFKKNLIREREEQARKARELDREMEVAIQQQDAAKSGKKSPEKKEKKGSPGKSPDKKTPAKSPEKSPKKSPSPKGGKKASPPKKKDDRGSPTGGNAVNARVNFYKDEVVGEDVIRVQDVNPLGFYRLLRTCAICECPYKCYLERDIQMGNFIWRMVKEKVFFSMPVFTGYKRGAMSSILEADSTSA